jgi:hypothetical protein
MNSTSDLYPFGRGNGWDDEVMDRAEAECSGYPTSTEGPDPTPRDLSDAQNNAASDVDRALEAHFGADWDLYGDGPTGDVSACQSSIEEVWTPNRTIRINYE